MKIDKIKNNKDFTSIYNNSKKVYTRYAIIFISENKNKKQRFGFVASKKTGNSVKRNRIKRLFKEFVRNNIEKFKYVISMTKFCSHLTEYKCNRHPGYIRLLPTQGISTINSILDSLI